MYCLLYNACCAPCCYLLSNVYSTVCIVCSTMYAARRVLICCITYTVQHHLMSAPCCVYIVYYTSVPLRAALRPASAAFGELHTASLFPPTRGAAATLPPHGRGGQPVLVRSRQEVYLAPRYLGLVSFRPAPTWGRLPAYDLAAWLAGWPAFGT